ncbi:septum formation inhibitor Maf [Ascidiimonas sp. W6]|uniref:septum formation inhibitor Maf n=1 Tax=Ascidiimonas meishanensis TaxID=3128903 RepID=UPI0030EC123B
MKLKIHIPIVAVLAASLAIGCSQKNNTPDRKEIAPTTLIPEIEKRTIPKEFSDYWYRGKAEITSYELTQARYGELREGTAVFVFVTEDFLREKQVKADQKDPDNIPVLKLNTTKNFLTGIYPYSIMTSTFYPVKDKKHAIKISNSVQEWCGHVYAQLNNRDNFEIMAHSYFQSEADQEFEVEKSYLENEFWTQIRLNPEELPTGNIEVIPSFEYLRLRHIDFRAYQANAFISKSDSNTIYTLNYPNLKRTLKIEFTNNFPYAIEGWEETFTSGFGADAKQLTTKGIKKSRIKSAYWQKNSNVDVHLRDSLGI